MTYFLNAPAAPPKIKGGNPDIDLVGLSGGLGAAFTVSSVENDANFKAHREFRKSEDDVAYRAAERLGIDAIVSKGEGIGAYDHIRKAPNSIEEAFHSEGYAMTERVMEMARASAQSDPDAWADIDLSEEGMFNTATERMKAEHEDAVQTLEMMPWGQGVSGFVGGMAGITVDVKNLPFMLLGGGPGSIFRVMGREAMINTAAEAAFLPAQFRMAERLDIPEPNVATQLSMAAAGGAIIGGAVDAGRRGVILWKGRNAVRNLPADVDEIELSSLIDRAEDILESDTPNPIEKINEIAKASKPEPNAATDREPLILRDSDQITTESLPPVDGRTEQPNPAQDLIELAQNALSEAVKNDAVGTKPLINFLRNSHRAKGLPGSGGIAAESLQIHPDGTIGKELKARGVTSRTVPGLFSKKGRKDLDNLVASEMEEVFPGIMDATGTKYGDNYLDGNGLLDLIVRDIEGDASWLRTRNDVLEQEQVLNDLIEGRTATQDFTENVPNPDPDSLYIDHNQYFFEQAEDVAKEQIANDVYWWLRKRGYADELSDEQMSEIVHELQAYGGDADYLVERVAERELDFELSRPKMEEQSNVEIPWDDPIPVRGNEPAEEIPVGEVRPDTSGQETPGRRAAERGQDDAADRGPLSEQTGAGEQTLIDGVAPITQRDRLNAAQNAPMRGGNAEPDIGLFDTGARDQRDMFSDPASPETQKFQDTVAEDMKVEIVSDGDFTVDLGDGLGERKASEVFEELDADQNFVEIADQCGRPKA